MTTVSPYTVDSATATTNRLLATTVGDQSTASDTIDQAGYLKLLTAQIQYQDPFSPMDNTQMVAQMTSFSQLAGQNEANEKLQSIADSLSTARMSDAASWIGKTMLVESSQIAPDALGGYGGQVTLAKDSASVAVDLVDGNNNVIKTLDLGAQSAGDTSFYWDGNDADGNPVDAGTLTMRVRGTTGATTASWASIAAVQSPASGTDSKLITPIGSFTASDALSLG